MAEILDIAQLKLKKKIDLTLLLENERSRLRFLFEDAAFYKGYAEQKGNGALILRDICWDIEDEARAMHEKVNEALTHGPVEEALLNEARALQQELQPRLEQTKNALSRINPSTK